MSTYNIHICMQNINFVKYVTSHAYKLMFLLYAYCLIVYFLKSKILIEKIMK